MDRIEQTLARFDGGRVLDVATQDGRFARVLRDSLLSYESIVGIDVNERFIEAAREATNEGDLSFSVMEAERLEYEDASFDTVSISASLHHMADIDVVLGEMMRVLKPGGRLIVVEMYADAGTESELTSTHLHRWAAEIDTAMGRLHNQTLPRWEILSRVSRLGLDNVVVEDCLDTDSDPFEQSRIQHIDRVIRIIMERAAETPGCAGLSERGRGLLERLSRVGARNEPVVMAIGERPPGA